MKQPLILTLLIIVSICTSMAQQMDRPDMKHTSPIQQERSDSSIEQPCLIDRDLPAQQTAASIVTESLGMGLSATLDTPVQSDFFENMRSDATVNTPLAIGNKPPKETKSGDIEQPEPQKKRSKIRISLFKKPEGKEQTRRVLWRDGRWAGIGIHYSGMVTNLGNFSLPAGAERMTQSVKSIGVTLNPVDFILVGNQSFRLLTGLGFELNNFRFDQDIALKYENGVTTVDEQYLAQGVNLSKSKLFTAYMNIPILIEFQTGRNHNFFINGGVIGGLRIGAHTKIQGKSSIIGGTAKDHSSFGLRNFHYGYTLNFGYSHIGFNLTYYHSPLWRKGAGPQVRQVNAGISLVF